MSRLLQSHLYNAAVAHDTDEVSSLDGAEAMGNDEYSPACSGPVQSLLYHML